MKFATPLLAPVERAVSAGVAGPSGAVVDTERHLVSVGLVTGDEEWWGTIEGIADPSALDPLPFAVCNDVTPKEEPISL